MFAVEQTLTLPRSAEEVFAFLSDPRNELKWRSDLRDVKLLGDRPLRVGSQIQTEVAFLGRQYPIYEVTVSEPPVREVLVGRSGPLRGQRHHVPGRVGRRLEQPLHPAVRSQAQRSAAARRADHARAVQAGAREVHGEPERVYDRKRAPRLAHGQFRTCLRRMTGMHTWGRVSRA